MMKGLLYASVFLMTVMTVCGCGKGVSPSDVEDATPDSVDSTSVTDERDSIEALVESELAEERADGYFGDFIYAFMTNRRFQTERITFPLPCRNEDGSTAMLKKGDWKYSRLYLNMDYLTVFLDKKSSLSLINSGDLSEVTLERLDLINDLVRDYVFVKRNGKWMMAEIKKYAVDEHEDAAFILFYQQFATDSAFQHAHLAPTIHFVTENADDELEEISGLLDADQWTAFRPELPKNEFTNMDYGQMARMGDNRVVAIQGTSDSFLNLLYFRRSSNGWTLYKFEN